MKKLGDSPVHEVVLGKRSIVLDLPIQIGVNILLEAKLHMLKFVYSFVNVFIPRHLRSTILMDTDSWYAAFGGESLEDCVYENKKFEFYHRMHSFCQDDYRHPETFLPRRCCTKHNEDDLKEPGIFKREVRNAKQIIALCSKTYVCELKDESIKLSAKGVNNKIVMKSDPVAKFKTVLDSKVKTGSINTGFVERKGKVYTYECYRNAFPWFYIKREVLPGGCYTRTIDVVLNPCPRQCLTLQGELELLAPDFVLEFMYKLDNQTLQFRTIRQALCYLKRHFRSYSPAKHNAVSRKAEKEHQILLTAPSTILATTSARVIDYYMNKMGNCQLFNAYKTSLIEKIIDHRMQQYPQLCDILKSTVGHKLVNACIYDSEWGNGANHLVTRWRKDAYAQGENTLGWVYSKYRTRLLTQS